MSDELPVYACVRPCACCCPLCACAQVLRLVSWLLPGMSKFAYGLELYGGLLVFSGYVLFDTQVGARQCLSATM